MPNHTALHEALRTEVVDRHSVSGLSYVLVRLQRGKTDISFTLHAEPTLFNVSGQFMSGHVLERLGFSVGDCAFTERRKCLARTVEEGFNIRSFANAVEATTEDLRQGCKALLECGYYVETQLFGTGGMGHLPEQMLSAARGDGHNAAKTQRLKESEDESFRFVFTWLDSGEGKKGWTTHYVAKHPPLSEEVSSMLAFLGLARFPECPEADFDPYLWRFMHFIPGDRPFNGPADLAHKWFEAHAANFSRGISKMLSAEATIAQFGLHVLPAVKTNVPVESLQPPRRLQKRLPTPSTKATGGAASAAGATAGAPTLSPQAPAVYDVAISFAGPQRQLAETLAQRVRDAGFDVFYDGFYPEQLWGKDLAVFFDDVFRRKARYCTIFVSTDYVQRPWTNHERSSAVSRMIEAKGSEYILPIKVDNIELPGVQPTIGYVSLRDFSVEQIADILIAKLRS